jgi:hypothetical protein
MSSDDAATPPPAPVDDAGDAPAAEDPPPAAAADNGEVDSETLGNWASDFPEYNGLTGVEATSRLPADHRLASKVTLWKGDIWKLQNIGAMVNSTNETLSDKSGLCKFILEAGGPDLKSACEGSEGCRTGEAIATDPGSLMCRCVSSLPAPASCALD